MGFKRIHPSCSESGPSKPGSNPKPLSYSVSPPPSKKSRTMTKDSGIDSLAGVKIHVLQAKLSGEEVEELISLAEHAGATVCASPTSADVLITRVRMRRRLERHVPWALAKEKSIVAPDWLRDSVQAGHALPCGSFAAINDLRDDTIRNCPGNVNCTGCSGCPLPSPPSSPLSYNEGLNRVLPPQPTFSPSTGVSLGPTVRPTDITKLDYKARYACARAAPLMCPNQALVRQLAVIRRSRELEGEQRSALSYQRAIGTIKAYPHQLTSISQVTELPYIGPKITSMVEEFIDTGRITASREIASSERFVALSTFADVYGIGPVTARRLYALGLRTIDDLRLYYGVNAESDNEVEDDGGETGAQEGSEEAGVKAGLALYEDLCINGNCLLTYRIPRDEVEEMAHLVYTELCAIQPGCAFTIVGGYRRGKLDSNDVDIVFTHPESGKERGLCKRLVRRLKEKGMVSHVMHLSSFRSAPKPHTSDTHWDTLEKALTVFRLPPSSPLYDRSCKMRGSEHEEDEGAAASEETSRSREGKGKIPVKEAPRRKPISRRLDLIFAPVEVYWCAVIGWTGSMMFERDIRQWTKDKKGWKFDSSGITRLSDSSLILARSELEVFEMCGLEWVDPTLRNADA